MIRLNTVRFVALAVGLLAAGTAMAQEDEAVPASDTTVSYGDWSQHCMLVQVQKQGEQTPGAPQRICEVTQTLNVQQEGGQVQRLLTIAVGKLPDSDNQRIVVQTPSNVALRAGVKMTLSDEPPAAPSKGGAVSADEAAAEGTDILLTYLTCAQVCVAEKELSGAQVEALKQTVSASVTFDMTSGQTLSVPLSMKGFKAALSAAPPVN
ncbi:invasion associated locus B family protein [Martelella mediterranea]|uniref:Invasion protein B, involved in pathogenesis n=1 Tax=Martelella mediterranea DSM 17316 TaxID=1122214 RepID=A0A1U9YYM8_9HYPH|nr:invasion associated locus B family protein [Martelella mediterranea]AQZ50551.1 Invasion protein B, involved in pathogenesis [Martelella mediterranea DSM 17316]